MNRWAVVALVGYAVAASAVGGLAGGLSAVGVAAGLNVFSGTRAVQWVVSDEPA